MSTESIVALCAGIVAIIAALGALVAALKNGFKLKTDSEDKNEQLAQIHVLVNSRLSEALDEIELLKSRIAVMDEFMTAKDKKASESLLEDKK